MLEFVVTLIVISVYMMASWHVINTLHDYYQRDEPRPLFLLAGIFWPIVVIFLFLAMHVTYLWDGEFEEEEE